MEAKHFNCLNCNHYQFTTEFGECEECGYEDLVNVTQEEYERGSKMSNENTYWVVDLQNYTDVTERTLDDAKDFLKGFWNEEDFESEQEMDDHFARIDIANADELIELLMGVDYYLFKSHEEYLEYAEFEKLKDDVMKVLKKDRYKHMLCKSRFVDNTLEFYACKEERMAVKVTFIDDGKISIEDMLENGKVWTFRRIINTNITLPFRKDEIKS